MKKLTKLTILLIAVFMVMQVILPTISLAADAVKLNIQEQRPYNDDDGDGTEGNDIYYLNRNQADQAIVKIGEQTGIDENNKPILNYNNAYYCLRGGLGFGSTEKILRQGLDYEKIADLHNKEEIINYFKNIIGYEAFSEANYNSIYWIVNNMYLPKSKNAVEIKQYLFANAGITSSQLTDDDIEVVQQIALWYFTNYGENGEGNSVSLADTVHLQNFLKINGYLHSDSENDSLSEARTEDIHKLYRYFVDNAKANSSEIVEKIPTEVQLDQTLGPTIETKTVPGISLDSYVVGPFKINTNQENNIRGSFKYKLKYKSNNTQTEFTEISFEELNKDATTIYLSDANGVELDRTQYLEDMLGAESFYITILKDISGVSDISEFQLEICFDPHYYITTAEFLVATVEDQQPVLKVEKEKQDPQTSVVTVKSEQKEFDLALRKFITGIERNGNTIKFESREPKIYTETLINGTFNRKGEFEHTATYVHSKEPLTLKIGDTIIYTIRVYNEGDLNGYATKVTDYLIDGLEFIEDSNINKQYGWASSEDEKTVTTNYLADKEIKAYNSEMKQELVSRDDLWQKSEDGTDGLYYADLQIECKIKDTATEGDLLPNIAAITGANPEEDRDSKPEELKEDELREYEDRIQNVNDDEYKSIQDDDDYERVIIEPKKAFDLSLRKYISNIERKGETIEFDSREPEVDTAPLEENKSTAKYTHPKNILTVKQGDIITYKLRVYNEGELDGYATEITDYIPEGLGLLVGYSGNDSWLIKSETNKPQPLFGENGIYKTEKDVPVTGVFKDEDLANIQIVTGKDGILKIADSYSLKEELIKKYGSVVEEGDLYQVSSNNENDGLFYQEIEVTCIVLAPNTYEGNLVNIAEISDDKAVETIINKDNEEIETEVVGEAGKDRDSNPDNVNLENYELREENSTYQQDDDDYEPVQLKYFDLALRKFITGVNEEKVDTRIPEFYIDEEGNYKYKHDKTQVEVVDNDNVTYTIRVFNEGTIAGFAEEIEDDIPAGLIFLPEDKTNKEYGWKMYYYDEEGVLVETDKVEEATVIRTNYLSEAKGTIDEETAKNSNLLEVFNKETMESPNYRDVKVVFKVSQEDIPEENEDGVITNKAHITEDSDDDEDSTPDEWESKPRDDDQDIEKIYVQKFDLALFKWVTKTIVTVDGKTTTTETGFKPNIGHTEATGEDYRSNDEEEPIASVTIDKKKLKSTVVKFVYNIKVVNEGDIAGFATEVTDYIPEGLKFVVEDNPLWTLEEDNKITTRALETKLLEPGESAEVPVTFTWINDAENLGLKTNIAAITEDYNDKGVEDEDSKPGNEDIPNYEKEQEDDDDFALVILTLKTGARENYIWLILLTITIISSGAVLIKKYVL